MIQSYKLYLKQKLTWVVNTNLFGKETSRKYSRLWQLDFFHVRPVLSHNGADSRFIAVIIGTGNPGAFVKSNTGCAKEQHSLHSTRCGFECFRIRKQIA